MEDSKLIQLLKTFSKTEMNEFGKFIKSPFFNESSKLISLYELMKDSYPEFNTTSFNNNKIFWQLYPEEKKYDDKKVRSRLNLMLNLAEEFLIQMEMKKDITASGNYILNQFASRKLETHFNKKFRQMNENIQKSDIINNKYFMDRYLMVKAKRNFYEFTKPRGKREEYYKEFSEETELLVKYSVIKLIKYYVIMRHDQDYLNYPFDYSFLQKLMEYIDEKKYSEYPIFGIFRNLLLLEENFLNEKLFHETKLLFYENISFIEKEDAILIISKLYNLATKYFYSGKNKFVNIPFEIISQMIKHEIYPLENGYMSEIHYLDTVYTAFTVKENEWAERFINDFRMKLNPEVRNNAFNYSLSLIEMIKENYPKALEGFAKVRVDDFFYYMRIKYNKFRIYFEMEDFETIFTEIDSFKHYLSTNKVIPDDYRSRASNFLSFFKRLVNARINNDYADIALLKKILEDTDMELKSTLHMLIDKILKQKKN